MDGMAFLLLSDISKWFLSLCRFQISCHWKGWLQSTPCKAANLKVYHVWILRFFMWGCASSVSCCFLLRSLSLTRLRQEGSAGNGQDQAQLFKKPAKSESDLLCTSCILVQQSTFSLELAKQMSWCCTIFVCLKPLRDSLHGNWCKHFFNAHFDF